MSIPAGPAARRPAEAAAAYRDAASRKSDVERQENKDKTGVFLGTWAINPATGAPVPIFVADYVLMGYGTGAIMAVPAQDARDLEFAHALRAAGGADGDGPRMITHRTRPGPVTDW